MTELFADLSQETKDMITSYIDITLATIEPIKIPQFIYDFARTMPTEEASDFVDFYFNLKLEELRNGDNNN